MNNYKCLTMVILGKRQANYRETTSLTNTFPCTLKQIPILFLLDSITDPVISGSERAEFTSSCNTYIMCQ